MKSPENTDIYSVSYIVFHDEARHDKTFAGLLKKFRLKIRREL